MPQKQVIFLSGRIYIYFTDFAERCVKPYVSEFLRAWAGSIIVSKVHLDLISEDCLWISLFQKKE